jgi:hypothetical protein
MFVAARVMENGDKKNSNLKIQRVRLIATHDRGLPFTRTRLPFQQTHF